MKVLVACEFSQVVQDAFLRRGCDSYSCDLVETIGPNKNRHIIGDAREVVLSDNWDLIIAHPPCTYLSNAGVCRLHDPGRYEKMLEAREFFMFFYNLPGRVCIENPVPHHYADLPKPSFDVDPFNYGDEYSKRTYLWLKNLPPFMPKCLSYPKYFLCAKYSDARRRSIFSPGIADAMAEAWSDL